MSAQYHHHRDLIDPEGGVDRFCEQGFTGTLQQLLGSAEPAALTGGEEEDSGMEDTRHIQYLLQYRNHNEL